MVIHLSKGGNISLSKEAPGLQEVLVGLGWDVRETEGTMFDLDASAFLVDASGKSRSADDFIFYNNKSNANGSVVYGGDNRTGQGEGDDETIKIDVTKIPAGTVRIVIVVTIDEAESRKQNFGQIRNAYIRVVDNKLNKEIARFDLGEDASLETGIIFGEIYMHNGEWKFKAVGQGVKGGLEAFLVMFGLK